MGFGSSFYVSFFLVSPALAAGPPPFAHTRLTLSECGTADYQGTWVPGGPHGEIELKPFSMCMDNGEPFGGEGSVVQVYGCHGQFNQQWNYNVSEGLIRSLQEGNRCVSMDIDGLAFLTSKCDQKFSLKDGTFIHESTGKCVTAASSGPIIDAPKFNIVPGGIYSEGGSSGGDFAVQFHVAFSKHVTGVCGHDAQPYHCAVTRFPGDYLLPQTNESSVPYCYGCPDGYTVLYDKCKNHPQNVDVGMLPDYPRRVCGDGGKPGCIDDVANIYDQYIYLSRGECRTYIGGAEINTLAMYGMMTTDPTSQLKYVDKCNTTGGVDDDLECITHVMGPKVDLKPPAPYAKSRVRIVNVMPFIQDYNIGFEPTAFAYIPDKCYNTTNQCRMMVRFHGCGGNNGVNQNSTMHCFAESNDIIVFYPRIQTTNNCSRTYQNSAEISRGCWDGYGQLSEDYALQSGAHMSTVWRMVSHLAGL